MSAFQISVVAVEGGKWLNNDLLSKQLLWWNPNVQYECVCKLTAAVVMLLVSLPCCNTDFHIGGLCDVKTEK